MKFYRGVVVDNNDPLGAKRVRVRIYGIHDENATNNSNDRLVWAEVMGTTDFGLVGGVGVSSILRCGTGVYVVFDGEDPNKPIVMGTYCGIVQGGGGVFGDPTGTYPIKERKNFESEDNDPVSRVGRSDLHPLIDEDPESYILETPSGHVLILSSNNIVISHKSGTIISVDESGILNIKTVDDANIEINGDLICSVKENLDFTIEKNAKFFSKGKMDFLSVGKMNIKSDTQIDQQAPRINLN